MKVVEFKSQLEVNKDNVLEAIKDEGTKEVYCLIVDEDGQAWMISTHNNERDLAWASQVFMDTVRNEIMAGQEEEMDA